MNLVGKCIDGNWTVEREVLKAAHATGQNFSRTYLVKNSKGDIAFLKVLDYLRALQTSNPALALHSMTQDFLFEQHVLELCKEKNLSRVVRQVAHGTIDILMGSTTSKAQYLVLELGGQDLRASLPALGKGARVRTLHHVAVGVGQLHGIGVAHQDVKPSNVLMFPGIGAKVGDLGRASQQGVARDIDKSGIAGDLTYAPPEFLYGVTPPDWRLRRVGCDLYMLGSLMFLVWSSVGLTQAIFTSVPPNLRPGFWQGVYADVLPALQSSFEDCMRSLEQQMGDDRLHPILGMVRELCNPDPSKRGANGASPVPLQRIITKLDLIARRLELAGA